MFPDTPIGPCEVWLGTTLASATKACDIHTSLNLAFAEEYAESRMAKSGTFARHKIVVGGSCKATGAAGEATIAQLAALTGQAADSGDTRLALKARVGTDLRNSAKVAILKPIIGSALAASTEWYVMPAATLEVAWDVPFSADGDREYGFVIQGHPVTADEVDSGGRIAGEGFEENDLLVLGA
jgi:hypothetical protein